MKIFLIGWFGSGNMGDEAILVSELILLKESIKDVELYVLSFDYERTKRLTANIPEVKKIVRISAKHNVIRSDFLGLFKTFFRVDRVVIGGGGIFQDIYNHYPIPFFTLLALFARICGKKPTLYCVGIGPFNTMIGKKLTQIAATVSELVSVRDRESRKLLKDLGVSKPVHVAADPVFLLKPKNNEKAHEIVRKYAVHKNKGPVIGVCVQELFPWHDDFRRILSEIFDTLVIKSNAKIVFIPFGVYRDKWFDQNNGDFVDVAASKKLAGFMKENISIIAEEMDPRELMAVTGSFDLIISMRLHGAIMGLSMARPVVALTYKNEIKVKDLMRRVDQMENLFYVDNIEKERLLKRIHFLLSEKKQVTEQLEKAVHSLRGDSEAFNSLWIKKMISKRQAS